MEKTGFPFLSFIFDPVRKRNAIESYGNSETFNKLTGLIGSGGLSVTAAVEIASSVVQDHQIPHEALKAFSTLGSSGDHPQNYERDLFRWLSNCFGMRLQPYTIYLDLQVSVLFICKFLKVSAFWTYPQKKMLLLKLNWISLTCSTHPVLVVEVSSKKVQRTAVKVLLPHEIIHTMATCSSPIVFDSVMLGCFSNEARESFWHHVQSLDAWATHPVFNLEGLSLKKLIGVTIHGDGAVMKRDDESFVYSMSSCFSHFGSFKDTLMLKFPIAIIPERHMRSKSVLWLTLNRKLFIVFFFWPGDPRIFFECPLYPCFFLPYLPLPGSNCSERNHSWPRRVVFGLRIQRCSSWQRFLWWRVFPEHEPISS